GAVQPLVLGFEQVLGTALPDALEQRGDRAGMPGLCGPNPVVIAAAEAAPVPGERVGHAIDPRLRRDARSGVTPQAWVDRMADTFAGYWRRLGCSYDDWIRTTEPRHARSVTALLERIRQRRPQDLFEAEYEGLYCTGCEEFKTGAQIVDGHCVEHPTLELIPTRERNHFFRLSAYRDAVLERIRSGALSVEPEIRRNEVVRLLEAGLQDISISRQRQPWGIPFPGDPQQTVYVWFDALINYLSATGFPDAGFERLWPADLHVIEIGRAHV